MSEEAEKEIDAIKQRTDALGREILQMENQGAALIKKEIALEDRLVAVLGQMLELEKGKIADAKRAGAAKEAALMGRIAYLQNKQKEFEKRKEMVKHLKEKSLAIKEEMGNAERKMREEIAELYRIKEIKKKHAVEKEAQKAAKEAAEKAAQRAAEAAAEKAVKMAKAALKLKKAVPAKKPAVKLKKAKPKKAKAVKKAPKKKAVKRAKPKKAAAKKPAAVKKVVVKKPVKIKKPKARVPKLKLAKKPAFLDELPEEEEEEEVEEEEAEAAEEVPVEEEAPAEEEAAEEEEAPAEEEVAEEEAVPEEEAQPVEEEAPVEEVAAEEEQAEEEPSALLERVLEKAKEKVTEEEPAAEAEAKEPADYDFTEFSSVDVSISHPDWPEKSGAPSNALLSRGTGNFSFDLLQIPAQGRNVDDVVSQATIKIESNIGSRVLEKKKTGDKAFVVYSESHNGREFLNKAIFVMHLDNIFKLVFSAPTEQFDKINDIFWKAAKSISFK
jgi:hypothetical protein